MDWKTKCERLETLELSEQKGPYQSLPFTQEEDMHCMQLYNTAKINFSETYKEQNRIEPAVL